MSTFIAGLAATIVIGSIAVWTNDRIERWWKNRRIRQDAARVVGRTVVFRGRP